MNQSSQKKNVRPGAQRNPNIRHGGSPAKARIDVNDLGAAFLRFNHPLKANGMVLRHVRSHDQDRIRIEQILWRSRGSAASVSGAQTGHRRAMSYPGLVADANHAQAASKQLLD